MEWNFERLPDLEHERVKTAYAEKDINELLKIHDDYYLSGYDYCCDGDGTVTNGMMNWFGKFMEDNDYL